MIKINFNRLAYGWQPFVVVLSLILGLPAAAQTGSSPIEGELQDIAPTPPAAAVGSVIEIVCPEGIATSALQRDCNALVGSALEDDPNAGDALLEVIPDDASTALDTSQNSLTVQTGNINARLTALRRGAIGIDLSGLNFDTDEHYIPGSFLGELHDSATEGNASADTLGFSRLGLFINGNFGSGNKDVTANEDGFRFDTQGITAGLDYRFTDNFILGGAVGYANTETDIDSAVGNLDADSFTGSLFGTYYQSDKLYIDGSISYGHSSYDQHRNVRYALTDGTTVDQTFSADYDGDQFAATLSSGYELNFNRFTLTPQSRLQYIQADLNGYSENAVSNPSANGSGWGVKIDNQNLESFTLALGGHINYAVSQSWGVLFPYASFEWVHEFENDNDKVSGRFLGDPSRTTFFLPTDALDQDYFNLGIGLSVLFTKGSAAFLNYQTVLGYDDLDQHNVSAGIRFEF